MVKDLLTRDSGRFLHELVEPLVLQVLETGSTPGPSGVHLHVTLAVRHMCAGSLRETMMLAIEVVVAQALTQVLRALDINFGLTCLHDPANTALWMALAAARNVLDTTLLGRGGLSSERITLPLVVPNTGQSEPLLARFPFSHRVVAMLNAPQTRQAIEEAGAKALAAPWDLADSISLNIFGPDVAREWRARFGDTHDA